MRSTRNAEGIIRQDLNAATTNVTPVLLQRESSMFYLLKEAGALGPLAVRQYFTLKLQNTQESLLMMFNNEVYYLRIFPAFKILKFMSLNISTE